MINIREGISPGVTSLAHVELLELRVVSDADGLPGGIIRDLIFLFHFFFSKIIFISFLYFHMAKF